MQRHAGRVSVGPATALRDSRRGGGERITPRRAPRGRVCQRPGGEGALCTRPRWLAGAHGACSSRCDGRKVWTPPYRFLSGTGLSLEVGVVRGGGHLTKRVSELEPPPLLWGAVETPDPAASSGETRQASAASPRCGLSSWGRSCLGCGLLRDVSRRPVPGEPVRARTAHEDAGQLFPKTSGCLHLRKKTRTLTHSSPWIFAVFPQ